MYMPLEGSNANVCTLVNIPDLTKKVPITLKRNVIIASSKTHVLSDFLFSRIIREWSKAVPSSQGMKEAFSTGSQNHQPPQPSS